MRRATRAPATRAPSERPPRLARAANLALATLAALATHALPLAAQSDPGAEAGRRAGSASLHHGLPLAGHSLLVVVDGLQPADHLALRLEDALSAPPSVVAYLGNPASPQSLGVQTGSAAGTLITLWQADARGRVVLDIPLLDPDDVGRAIRLAPLQFPNREGETVVLRVLAPTLLLAAGSGHARLDLVHGVLRQPGLGGQGELSGLVVSPTGTALHALRADGRLERIDTADHGAQPGLITWLEAGTDVLAAGGGGALPFAVARPSGQPFTPAARLRFLSGADETLLLEPMGREVAGRRVAISPDGLSAWIAEDDLLVREVDLATRATRSVFGAGFGGDAAITDMLFDGRRLLVAARAPQGRRGSLSVLDLGTGRLATHLLAVDPARLVALDDGRTLIVPASGSTVEVVQNGVPGLLLSASGAVRDAAALPGGRFGPAGVAGQAVLAVATATDTVALELLDAGVGAVTATGLVAPGITRLVGPGHEASAGFIALLGAADGSVTLLDPAAAALRALPGIVVRPGEAFRTLP